MDLKQPPISLSGATDRRSSGRSLCFHCAHGEDDDDYNHDDDGDDYNNRDYNGEDDDYNDNDNDYNHDEDDDDQRFTWL